MTNETTRETERLSITHGDKEKAISVTGCAYRNESGIYAVICFQDADQSRYVGLSLNEFSLNGSIDMTRVQQGDLFLCKRPFRSVALVSWEGDSIAALFMDVVIRKGSPTIKKAIVQLNPCPIVPSPGRLIKIDETEELFNEFQNLLLDDARAEVPVVDR